MRGTEDLAVRELLLFRQVEDIERQFLTASVTALRAEITARFGVRAGPRPLGAQATTAFAEQYATAMTLAWLYGARHAQQLTEAQGGPVIRLAGERWAVPFKEAEAFLESLVSLNKPEYNALKAELKFRAFTIAKVGQEDLIERIRALYVEQAGVQADRAGLLQRLSAMLDEAGISEANPAWLQTHYRNNVMAAYNAGRWAQLQDNPDVAFLLYNAILDDHTTRLCEELDGTLLPIQDKAWASIHPPNHHNCRSIVTPVSRAQALARGLKPSRFSLGELHADAQLAKEHQFRAHPAAVLDAIPVSLATRASQRGQWGEILSFVARSSAKWLRERLAALRAMALGAATVAHVARKRPTPERDVRDAQQALSDPHEVWLGATADSAAGVRLSLISVRWGPGGRAAPGMTTVTRLTGGPKTFYTQTGPQLDAKAALYGWVRLH